MRRALRFLLIACCWLPLGAGAGLVVALALPFAGGARPYTVMSGSMEPAIDTGDVVIVRFIRPADARLGDVVTFDDPRHSGRLITHRVRAMSYRGDRLRFVTKGDANTAVERWSVPERGRIARVAYRIPTVGRVELAAGSGGLRLALVVLPALLLGAWLIRLIWRAPPPGEEVAVSPSAPE
jgi:signal peptidase